MSVQTDPNRNRNGYQSQNSSSDDDNTTALIVVVVMITIAAIMVFLFGSRPGEKARDRISDEADRLMGRDQHGLERIIRSLRRDFDDLRDDVEDRLKAMR